MQRGLIGGCRVSCEVLHDLLSLSHIRIPDPRKRRTHALYAIFQAFAWRISDSPTSGDTYPCCSSSSRMRTTRHRYHVQQQRRKLDSRSYDVPINIYRRFPRGLRSYAAEVFLYGTSTPSRTSVLHAVSRHGVAFYTADYASLTNVIFETRFPSYTIHCKIRLVASVVTVWDIS
ncbi:hypothetical protein BJV78DRAFT_823277 [Lactifluus subvellereus]|nr:hypothetical protein BJV78DRAFT_823277 [Lactifluus subvellereus]